MLSDILNSSLTSEVLGALAGNLGSDSGSTKSAIFQAALPMLVSALANNSKQSEGAQSLNNALEADHDGSILGDIAGFLGGGGGSGAKILGHIFGDKQPQAEEQISKASGLQGSQVASLLVSLAPIVMGALGKSKREQGLDASGLSSYLGAQADAAKKEASGGGLMSMLSFLDADGDGDIMDDIAAKLGGLLS